MDNLTLRSMLQVKMQLLTSQQCDFNDKTWTFTAPYFVVQSGDYLVIPVHEWQDLWNEIGK